MKVSCQACGAKYTIADEKVRGRKVKIRCKSCGTPIVVDGANSAPPDAPPAGAPAAAPVAAAGVSWSVNLSDTDQRTMTTQEVIDGWRAGVVTSDAFVWKDGMGDWVPILECAELKGHLPAPAAAAVATPPPATASGTPFGPTIVTAPAASNQARLAGGGRQGVDLFDATEGPDDDEVATSAPHLPMAGTSAYDDKMTGARNENSVLFSLDSLKGGLTGGSETKKSAPARPGTPAEDPFAMGTGDAIGAPAPLFSLNANQALLTAPAPPEPPPPRFDASGAPAKPLNKLLVYGGAAGGAVLLLLVGLLIGRGGREEDAAAEGEAKAAASAEGEKGEKPEKKSEEAKPEEKKAEEKKPEETAASASAAPSAAPDKVAAAPSPATNPGSGSKPTTTPSPGAGKAPAEKKKEEPPAVGTAPFSVSAAQVALTQAAANAGGCAKPGGPKGTGKATVTFATSGRVTSANVATPPFAGTPVGGCVAGVFRRARVPAFNGNPVTVSKSFTIR